MSREVETPLLAASTATVMLLPQVPAFLAGAVMLVAGPASRKI